MVVRVFPCARSARRCSGGVDGGGRQQRPNEPAAPRGSLHEQHLNRRLGSRAIARATPLRDADVTVAPQLLAPLFAARDGLIWLILTVVMGAHAARALLQGRLGAEPGAPLRRRADGDRPS
jgi:hypothetical protein